MEPRDVVPGPIIEPRWLDVDTAAQYLCMSRQRPDDVPTTEATSSSRAKRVSLTGKAPLGRRLAIQ